MPLTLLALPDDLVRRIVDASLQSFSASVRLRMVCKQLRRYVVFIMCDRLEQCITRCNLWFRMPSGADVFAVAREGETLSDIIARCKLPVHARYYDGISENFKGVDFIRKSVDLSNIALKMQGHQLMISVVRTRKRARGGF